VGVRYYLSDSKFKIRLDKLAAKFARYFQLSQVIVRSLDEKPGKTEAIKNNQDFTNVWFDMSGYQSTLTEQSDSSTFLYFNDTLFTKYYTRFLTKKLLSCCSCFQGADFPVLIGVINPSSDAVFYDHDYKASQHVSTFFFALNKSGNKIFRNILVSTPSYAAVDDWLLDKYGEYPALEKILHLNIFGHTNPWSWNTRSNIKDAQLLKRKAVTVAIEHMLSAEIVRQGGMLIPINRGLLFRVVNRTYKIMMKFRAMK
jgi:hypothetical protein